MWANFLGRPALFSSGAAVLHRTAGAAVWFAALLMDPDGQVDAVPALRLHLMRLAAGRPGSPNPTQGADQVDAAADCALMQNYATALESVLHNAPSQYFWWHRRWHDSDIVL